MGQATTARAPRLGWLRRIDDAVFAVEQAVVATFLIATTVLVFLDVVYRRLIAPDSKIGEAIAALTGLGDGGARAFVDAHVAPWVGAGLGVVLLWFGFWTAERHRGRPLLPFRHGPLLLAVAAAAGIGLLGWLMVHPGVESRAFYVLLYALGVGGWVLRLLVTRPPGWALRAVAVLGVVTPLFVWFALTYFPRGYSWSKEVSLVMLLWVGFVGASVCVHEGRHLRMEAFEKLLPARIARFVRALGFLAAAGFCAFMAVLGYRYVFDPLTGALVLGGVFEQTQIPDWLATIPVPIAFALTATRFVAAAASALQGGSYGRPVGELEAAKNQESARVDQAAPQTEEQS